MAFSFNPGQTPQAGGAPGASPFATVPASESPVVGLPVNSSSPFLFLRGEGMTLEAAIQALALVATILSILVASVLFTASFYLSTSVDSKKEELANKELEFKDYNLDDLKSLSDRFSALDTLLKNYISVRSPLKFLEDVVESKAYFNDFNLSADNKNAGKYTVSFSVITNNYPVLIQQLGALNLSQYSKVIPKTTVGELIPPKGDTFTVKVKVTAPITAQGILPDDVIFSTTQGASTQISLPTASSSLLKP